LWLGVHLPLPWTRIVAIEIAFVAYLSVLHLLVNDPEQRAVARSGQAGGFVGYIVSLPVSKLFGPGVALFFFGSVIVIALSYSTGIRRRHIRQALAFSSKQLELFAERMKREPAGRKTEYSVLKDDFFVISGLQNLKRFYVRAQLKGDEVRGITILYDQAMQGIMEPIVVAMSSAFAPFPSGRPVLPPPRRKVEYASGVSVGQGVIVTSREALEGCHVVTIAGIGGADRVADDKASRLALLRVHGANLNAVALAGAAPKGDVTLLGIAEPQSQGGGAAVSPAKARVSDALVLDPAPALGFDGAAALDAEGRLAGIAVLDMPLVAGTAPGPSATAALMPVEAIRALLAEQKIVADGAAAGTEAAKGSIVRVICVRK